MIQLYSQLKKFGQIKQGQSFSKMTSFKIGGPISWLLAISSEENLLACIEFLEERGIEHFLLGGGTNMLGSDDGFDGVVIQYKHDAYKKDGNTITVGAGALTVTVANQTIKDGLTGFEWGVGVPGTIGGAVRGNAGASGGEIKDTLTGVRALIDGDILELSNEECEFGYRSSRFKTSGGIVLEATFTLAQAESTEGKKAALDVLAYRIKTQPKGYASTGCIFKNVEIDELHHNDVRKAFLDHADTNDPKVQAFLEKNIVSAGWLIDTSGLKGKRVGNAQVSDIHGNFIINTGGATAQDVSTLIEQIKEEVYNTYGIRIEEEIHRIC